VLIAGKFKLELACSSVIDIKNFLEKAGMYYFDNLSEN
jgi:hypothetical protein